MKIRTMTEQDAAFAAALVGAEGWLTESEESFSALIDLSPGGVFIAELEKKRIGICAGVVYADFGFLGEFIVHEKYRGKGYGRLLFNHTIAYMQSRGVKSILLHGDEAAVPIYEKAGFRKICRAINYMGVMPELNNPQRIFPMQREDLISVNILDRQAFGADRSVLLQHLYRNMPECAFVSRNSRGKVNGYVLCRKGTGIVAMGPLIAEDEKTAENLIMGLSAFLKGTAVRIDILENNARAKKVVKVSGFLNAAGYSWRMASGGWNTGANENMAFAVGTPATG